jgi:hypothetical protein
MSGQVYIGQTGSLVETRIKEHHHHIRLVRPEKSGVTQHIIDHDQIIKFQETKVVATKRGYLVCLFREAIELELYHNTQMGDGGLIFSKS